MCNFSSSAACNLLPPCFRKVYRILWCGRLIDEIPRIQQLQTIQWLGTGHIEFVALTNITYSDVSNNRSTTYTEVIL
jgi:hypothetical protein